MIGFFFVASCSGGWGSCIPVDLWFLRLIYFVWLLFFWALEAVWSWSIHGCFHLICSAFWLWCSPLVLECWFSWLDSSSYPSWVLVLWIWVVCYCGVVLFFCGFFAVRFLGCFLVFAGWSLVSGFCCVFFIIVVVSLFCVLDLLLFCSSPSWRVLSTF